MLTVEGAPGRGQADLYLPVNQDVQASRNLAEYYCRKRGVPRDDILTLGLVIDAERSCGSDEQELAQPLLSCSSRSGRAQRACGAAQ